jgi:hypothetical protein
MLAEGQDKVSVAKTKMPKDVEEPIITEVNFSEPSYTLTFPAARA